MEATRSGSRWMRFLARVLLRSHYRRIEVAGADRVPAEGAALFVANHQNSLVDSLALVHASPRPAAPLAKAPLWKSPLLRPFLDALEAVPVYRPQDEEENEGRSVRGNLETFRACHERLRAGGSIVLFPEGVSQPRPRLMPLRTGAARIALDAGVPVSVVPVGLAYEPPTRTRRGSLLVRFGEPFVVDGTASPSRRRAIVETTKRIEAALRSLLAEAESQGDLATLRTLRGIWDAERGTPPPVTLEEDLERVRRFAAAYRTLGEREPAMLEALRAETDAYLRALEMARVPPSALDLDYTPSRMALHLVRQAAFHLFVTPLGVLGGLVTAPARAVAEVVALRTSRGSEDVWVLGRIASNLLVFPVYTALAAGAVGVAFGWRWALATLLGLPLLLALHIVWRDRRDRARGRSHAFFLLAGSALRSDLRRRRHALFERLEAVSARVGAAP